MSSVLEDRLDEIQQWAQLQFTASEIALLTGVTLDDLKRRIADDDDPVSKAYHRGRLLGEAAVRKGVHDAAVAGSAIASHVFGRYVKGLRENGESDENGVAQDDDVDISELLVTVHAEKK